jgi:pSer/pThr/pTyr-binding forkhead associated (FHA) protein
MVFIRAWHVDCSDEVQEQELSAGQITIGRGLDNDILLDVVGASRHHARVELDEGEIWVVDLGSTNGTWVGGERVERRRLQTGDRFQIGAMVFEVASSSLTRPTVIENWADVRIAEEARPAGVRLRHERGGLSRAVVSVVEPADRRPVPSEREIPPRGLAFGRDPTNDLCLDDTEVSRFHARIDLRGPQYLLEDLGSRNGTWVNRILVRQHILSSGDTFAVGPFTLRFSLADGSRKERTRPEVPLGRVADTPKPPSEPLPPTRAVPTGIDQPLSARCTSCGAELEAGASVCSACGHQHDPDRA